MNKFNYIFSGTFHEDTSQEYMEQIGMSQDQIDSVLAQKEFEVSQYRESLIVSRFQARAVLREMGIRDDVEALINQQDTPELVKDAWADAQQFRRTSPTIEWMGQQLGLTDEDIDDMFEAASKIEA